MVSVNKVILIGRLGRDPEMRHTPSGAGVCTLNLATTETWNDNGQKQERTEWHRVTVWGKQGENCAKYLAKGRSVYIEGKLQTRSWDDKDGQKRYSTDIVANMVQFLESGRGNTQQQDQNQLSSFNPPHSEPQAAESVFGSHNASNLDDIPF